MRTIEECPIQKLETAATVIQDLKKELHKCMMENIEKLTGREIEAVIFVIHLIYSGGAENVDENAAVAAIFKGVLEKFLKMNLHNNYWGLLLRIKDQT